MVVSLVHVDSLDESWISGLMAIRIKALLPRFTLFFGSLFLSYRMAEICEDEILKHFVLHGLVTGCDDRSGPNSQSSRKSEWEFLYLCKSFPSTPKTRVKQ